MMTAALRARPKGISYYTVMDNSVELAIPLRRSSDVLRTRGPMRRMLHSLPSLILPTEEAQATAQSFGKAAVPTAETI